LTAPRSAGGVDDGMPSMPKSTRIASISTYDRPKVSSSG
jgi:hypothetical protein